MTQRLILVFDDETTARRAAGRLAATSDTGAPQDRSVSGARHAHDSANELPTIGPRDIRPETIRVGHHDDAAAIGRSDQQIEARDVAVGFGAISPTTAWGGAKGIVLGATIGAVVGFVVGLVVQIADLPRPVSGLVAAAIVAVAGAAVGFVFGEGVEPGRQDATGSRGATVTVSAELDVSSEPDPAVTAIELGARSGRLIDLTAIDELSDERQHGGR